MYLEAEELLISAAGNGEVLKDNYTHSCNHFGQNLDHFRLGNQLRILSNVVSDSNPCLSDIQASLLSLNTSSVLLSEVQRLLQLLFVIPASAERSLSE